MDGEGKGVPAPSTMVVSVGYIKPHPIYPTAPNQSIVPLIYRAELTAATQDTVMKVERHRNANEMRSRSEKHKYVKDLV